MRDRGTAAFVVLLVGAVLVLGLGSPASATAPRAKKSCSVELGISYLGGVAAASSSVGTSASSTPTDDQLEQQLQVGVDALNSGGGIAGCQVKSVIYNFKATGDWTTQSQEECTTFTQDHHVVAAIPLSGFEGQNFLDCMTKAKTAVVGMRYPVSNAGFKQKSPYLYEPGTLGFSDYGAMVATLKKSGFLTTTSKVGIVSNDTPNDQYLVESVIKPALKKLKIPFAAEASFTAATSVNTLTAGFAQAPAAVLKFKDAGVDRVIGTNFFFFMSTAQSQDFHPQYGGLGDFGATLNYLPAAQLTDAVVVTAQPGPVICGTSIGGTCAQYSQVPNNAAKKHCDTVYQGKTVPANAPPPLNFCTQLDFVQTTLAKATKPNAAQMSAGMQGLGTSFVAANAIGPTKFGAGLPPTGATQLAMMKYDSSTKTMVISGSFIKIP